MYLYSFRSDGFKEQFDLEPFSKQQLITMTFYENIPLRTEAIVQVEKFQEHKEQFFPKPVKPHVDQICDNPCCSPANYINLSIEPLQGLE